jgi:plasmid stability protein
MATLRVENIPDDLYSALRKQAKLRGRSIAQEVVSLLEVHVPTSGEQRRRDLLLQKALRGTAGPDSAHPTSTEETLREDRTR